jgi:hypothetical protein
MSTDSLWNCAASLAAKSPRAPYPQRFAAISGLLSLLGRSPWLLLMVCCVVFLASAQEFRASISGTVTDPTGAAVVGARVEVTDVPRKLTSVTTTNEVGRYTVEFLLPSTYSLSVEASGFKKYVRENFALGINDRVAINANLELGTLTESIVVSGEVSPLQTETANRGGLVPYTMVQNLPNTGTSVFALVFLMPGAIRNNFAQNPGTGVGLAGGQGGSEFMINGNAALGNGRVWNNDVLVNGVTSTNNDNNLSFSPAIEAVQELQVKTNTYDASYGRTGGGFVTITTKAGANQPHGVVFDRHFNSALAANRFEYNRTGTKKPSTHLNNSGFQVDGPIFLPKLLDGRNKAFFMMSLDYYPQKVPATGTATVPLAAMHQGDFSGALTAAGQPVLIYDPKSVRLGPDGKTYVRDLFAGNQIPTSRFDPVGAKILSYYPNPNFTGIGPAQSNNFLNTNVDLWIIKQWIGRIDYRVNDKHSVYVQWGGSYNTQFGANVYGQREGDIAPLLNFGGTNPAGNRNWHAVLDWSANFNPATTWDLRAGWNRTEQIRSNDVAAKFNPLDLGLPASLVSQFWQLQFPAISFGTYGGSTSSRVNYLIAQQTMSLQGNLGKAIGSHLLKIGGEVRRYGDARIDAGNPSGQYAFAKNWTQGPNPLVGTATAGNEAATLLLGDPSSGSVSLNINPYWNARYYALYLQDDWKATRRLTLNLGLRWDYQAPLSERYNQITRGFAFDQASPIAAQVKAAPGVQNCPACANLMGGLLFAGSSGSARYAWDPYYKDFQPRLGVALQLDKNTVLRGGFGMYKLGEADPAWQGGGATNGFSSTTSIVTSLDGGLTPAVTMSNPFPDGLIKPFGKSLGLSTFLGSGVSFNFPAFHPATSYQYSVGVQRLLPGHFAAEVSYVGNYTADLQVGAGYNFIPTSQMSQPSSYYLQQVTNPFKGLLPNNASMNGATIPLQNLMYAYPQFTGVSGSDIPMGMTRYDAVQTVVTRRFHWGLTLIASYTISKCLERLQFLNAQFFNPTDPSQSVLDHRLTPFDLPQRLTIVGTYDLPVGRGRRFGANMAKPLNYAVGNWMLSWSVTQASGFPVDFPNAAPLTAKSAKLPSDQQSFYKWFDTSLFPKVAGPAPYTLRDFPTRFPDVRFMGMHNFDISLNKSFPIYERLKAELRADFINLFNHPFVTEMASLDVTNASFGMLNLRQRNDPRMIVLQFKLRF